MTELNPTTAEWVGTGAFVCAVLHSFAVKRLQHLATLYREGSVGENFFHLLGEIEIVFGLWAGVLLLGLVILNGFESAMEYMDTRSFTEPAFVFVIMAISSTQPVLNFTRRIISRIGSLLPLPRQAGYYLTVLTLGPLLGSLITEPSAMTVTALLLKDGYFQPERSRKFLYVTLAVLFVNVSVGGVLTHFAAPPVLMVAKPWNWTTPYVFTHLGWKAILVVSLNAVAATRFFWSELKKEDLTEVQPLSRHSPWWLIGCHLGFLSLVIFFGHHPKIFAGLFLFFLGFFSVSREYQTELKLRQSLLVAFFLAGLVVLGGLQTWWLQPLLTGLKGSALFLGSCFLTAFTDNAAITYLGAQIPNLSELLKYSLVSGAVVGGGLTVIANAPNPAGFSLLQSGFGKEGISPLTLFLSALFPTFVALVCFWFLP